MPQLYRLSPLLLLLALLACSRDNGRLAQNQPAGPRAASPSPVPPAARPVPPPTRPGSAATTYRAAAPAAAPGTVAATRAAAPMPPKRPQPARQWRPAPAAAGGGQAAPAASLPSPLPPDNQLQAWLDAEMPRPVQRFRVQPGRDTVLYGAQGTVLAIPADAFVVEGPATGPAGPVEVELREFYSLTDILLQNLSTTTGGELLETGGMLHLAARTAAGQPCTLRPGTELLLQMPAPAAPRPDMQLYAGVLTPQPRIDWQQPRPALRRDEFRGKGPVFPGRAGALKQRLARSIRYSWEDYQQLRGMGKNPGQRRFLRQASTQLVRRKRLLAYAQMMLRVDATGQVTDVVTTVTGDTTQLLADRLRQAALQLPRFRPAYLQGPIRRQYTSQSRVLSEVPRKRRRPTGPPLPRMPVVGSIDVDVLFTRNGRMVVQGSNLGSVGFGGAQVDPVKARQRLSDDAQPVAADSIGTYLFSAANLGWINCDRLLGSGQRVQFAVETGPAPARAQAQLVFRRYRSVLAGWSDGTGQHHFNRVPANEPAVIVAMKYEQGQAYLALQPTTLTRKTVGDLAFRPVTPAELRAALATLER